MVSNPVGDQDWLYKRFCNGFRKYGKTEMLKRIHGDFNTKLLILDEASSVPPDSFNRINPKITIEPKREKRDLKPDYPHYELDNVLNYGQWNHSAIVVTA